MATQNPIEQEGTYPLPEAQLDRFLLHVAIDYPQAEAETRILRLAREQASHAASGETTQPGVQVSETQILQARRAVLGTHLADGLERYIVDLVLASRDAGRYGAELQRWLSYGASPRATIALDRCARALAWLDGRDFVLPEDIQAIAPDVLRHRLLLSFEAEAEGIDADHVIGELLARVAPP